jgi:hypothetical protein
MTETIEVWERVVFQRGEPIAWQRSFDYGRTWTDVRWMGSKIPFALITWDEPVGMVTAIQRSQS